MELIGDVVSHGRRRSVRIRTAVGAGLEWLPSPWLYADSDSDFASATIGETDYWGGRRELSDLGSVSNEASLVEKQLRMDADEDCSAVRWEPARQVRLSM